MQHRVLDAISKIVTPERLVIYKDSVSILLLKDLSIYDMIFDNFHNSMFESDSVSNVADFDNLLIGNLRGLIEEFGIYIEMRVVSAESVEPLTYLAKMLYTYDHYDDQNEMLLMLDSPNPANEIIGEMVASMTVYNNVNVIMEHCQEVSTSCLKRMRKISTESLAVMDSAEGYSTEELIQIEYLAKLCQRFETREPLNMLENGWRLGHEMHEYADEMVAADSPMSPQNQVILFCLASVMANTPREKIKEEVGEYIQSRFDDKADVMMSAGRALKQVNLEV